jgi:hypothetical protein
LNATPVGRSSVALTFDGVPAPEFVTVSEYVRFWPAVTGSGESDCEIERSARVPFWLSSIRTSPGLVKNGVAARSL